MKYLQNLHQCLIEISIIHIEYINRYKALFFLHFCKGAYLDLERYECNGKFETIYDKHATQKLSIIFKNNNTI